MPDFVVGSLVTRMKMDANEFYREKQRAEKSTERLIAQLEHEKRVMQMGEDAARAYSLQMAGVSAEKVEAANKIAQEVRALRAEQEAMQSSHAGGGWMHSLKDQFGRGSEFTEFVHLLGRGGPLLGIALLGRELEHMAEKFKKIAEAAHEVHLSTGRWVGGIISALPIIGGFVKSGEAIGEMLGGKSTETMLKEAERYADLSREITKATREMDLFIAKQHEMQQADKEEQAGLAAANPYEQRIEKLQEMKRKLLGTEAYSPIDGGDQSPGAVQAMAAIMQRERELIAAMTEATAQAREGVQIADLAAEAKAEQIRLEKELIEQRQIENLAAQDELQIAQAHRHELDLQQKAMNEILVKRRQAQYAATLEREVEAPKRWREAVQKIAAADAAAAPVMLSTGTDASSADAMDRISRQGLRTEQDQDIQRAMLEISAQQAQDMKALRDAVIDYIRDPDKGFRP